MNDDKRSPAASSLSVLDVILITLQTVFIVLKCVGVITWPWLVVLIPLWIGLGITVITLVLIVILLIFIHHG